MNQYPTVGQVIRLILICLIAAVLAPAAIRAVFGFSSEPLGILVGELAILGLVAAFVRRLRLVPEDVLLLNATPPAVLLATAGCALCASFVVSQVDEWSAALFQQFDLGMPLGLQQSLLAVQIVGDVWELVLVAGGVVLAPGISEEALFRGVVFTALLVHRGPRVAVLGSALLFATVHFRPWQMPALVLFGLFLSALVYWTHSIYPAILAHLVNNTASVASVNIKVYWGIDLIGGDLHLSLLGAATLGLVVVYGLAWIRKQTPVLPLLSG